MTSPRMAVMVRLVKLLGAAALLATNAHGAVITKCGQAGTDYDVPSTPSLSSGLLASSSAVSAAAGNGIQQQCNTAALPTITPLSTPLPGSTPLSTPQPSSTPPSPAGSATAHTAPATAAAAQDDSWKLALLILSTLATCAAICAAGATWLAVRVKQSQYFTATAATAAAAIATNTATATVPAASARPAPATATSSTAAAAPPGTNHMTATLANNAATAGAGAGATAAPVTPVITLQDLWEKAGAVPSLDIIIMVGWWWAGPVWWAGGWGASGGRNNGGLVMVPQLSLACTGEMVGWL